MNHSKTLPAWLLTLALLFSLLPSAALAADSHTYGEPTFEWAEDYSTCTATFTCVDEDDNQTVDCTVVSETTATCTEDGETVYTASCEFDGETYSNQTGPVETAALGHTWEGSTTTYENFDRAYYDEEAGKVVSSSCTENGTYDAVVYCGRCGEVELVRRTLTAKAAGHTAGEASYENLNGIEYDEESGEFTSTIHAAEGSYDLVYYCTKCGDEISRETVTVSASDAHQWDEGEVTQAPTCTETGVMTYTCTVEGCGETKTETISATGHTYGDPVFTWAEDYSSCTATFTCVEGDVEQTRICVIKSETLAEASCTQDGQIKYTASTTFNGASCSDTQTVTIPATEHSWDSGNVTTAATCVTAGVMTYTCTVCEATKEEPISATGEHTYTSEVTTAATYTSKGVMTYTCSVCGTSYTEAIAVITSSFLFDDVQNASASYYGPVYWAYDNGITKGTSDTMFSPSKSCTRGQFVTFLWRLAGQPIVSTDNPFTDVTDTSASYYYAVLWAVKNGVTKGTSETTFSPSQTITRAQAVTFLYRYAGQPTVSTSNPFTDVTNTSASYYKAVLWAYENGVTKGTGDGSTFSPSSSCTRGQMVTFLYRFAVEPLS